MSEPIECPHCKATLQDYEIPEDEREMFGGKTHFSRLIGISNGDSVMWYVCPDCHGRIERDGSWDQGYRTCDIEIRVRGEEQ